MPSVDPARAEITRVLPGAQFADRFSLVLPDETIGAEEAARRMFSFTPRWIRGLMTLRDRLVAPFGLKTRPRMQGEGGPAPEGNWFPILERSPERMVLGSDDRHLDFRLILETEPAMPHGTRISSATVVRTHNFLGRAYLTAVLPFHKVIVPAVLRQAMRQGPVSPASRRSDTGAGSASMP